MNALRPSTSGWARQTPIWRSTIDTFIGRHKATYQE
jgi:hypothetical protein